MKSRYKAVKETWSQMVKNFNNRYTFETKQIKIPNECDIEVFKELIKRFYQLEPVVLLK